MATKKDVTSLLKSGQLTGLEAARLILQDSVEVDHGRDGFLSQRDIREITSNLSPAEGREYNKWIETYRILAYFIKDGQIAAWALACKLTEVGLLIREYRLDYQVRMVKHLMPQLVTEKQYQDIKAQQREALLQEYACLDAVISRQASRLAPPEIRGSIDDIGDIQEEYPELYQEAERQILELIEAGKLQQITLKHKPSEKDRPAYIEGWYREDASWSKEEKEWRLQTYIPVKELYEAGLPAWIEWVDEFKPDLTEDTAPSYAIIQPGGLGYLVDERGYFKGHDLLKGFSGLEQLEERWKAADGPGLKLYLQSVHGLIRMKLRNFLAAKSVIDSCSEILGVNFGEDIEARYTHILSSIELYNVLLKQATLGDAGKDYSGPQIKLPLLRVDKLKPGAQELRALRSQIATSLGTDWWEQVNTFIATEVQREERISLDYEEEPEPAEDEEVASGQEV